MWDNPRWLNFAANSLFAVAVFIVVCIGVLSVRNSSAFPLRVASVHGELRHLDRQAIQDALDGQVVGNFFAVDLEAVRNAFQALPWVRRVEIRKQWPDRLEIEVEEHVALARWSDQQLVNAYGELFEGKTGEALPQFGGPTGSATEVMQRHREFKQIVAPLGLDITHLTLSSRRAWLLKLAGRDRSALTIVLGRDQAAQTVSQRLQRFVGVYPQLLQSLKQNLEYVDLRYPNGFALRAEETLRPEAQRKRKDA